MNESRMLGRVLRSSSTDFTFGYNQPDDNPPIFGSLVRAAAGNTSVYALVYEVLIYDDPFVRQVVAAETALVEEKIQDMRQRRQVPVEITALAIAYDLDGNMFQRIPPRPPGALQPIYACSEEEVRITLTARDYFRNVLNSPHVPADELLAASLREAARCQLPGEQEQYLLRAGRELASLLAADLPRLDAILRRIAQ
jgi:hypothetical protein